MFNYLTVYVYFVAGVRADRVTAMKSTGQFLYASTRRGVIICINCTTMCPCTIMDAYYQPCRSLLLISMQEPPSKPFQRLFSRGIARQRPLSTSSSDSISSAGSSNFRRSSVGSSYVSEDDTNKSILVSFGRGYRGVVGESTSCPENFMLPSENVKTFVQPSTPDRTIGFLLLWSIECEKKDTMKFQNTDLLDIDETDSALPEELFQEYQDSDL